MPNRRSNRGSRRGLKNRMGKPGKGGVGKRMTSAMRGPRSRSRRGTQLPDLPFANATIVYESGAHNSKSIPYACPNGQTKLSEDCVELSEAQQALIANGSGTKQHGNFKLRGAGRGGTKG